MDKEREAVVAPASPVDRSAGAGQALSDEELTELALAADPNAGADADAIPLDELFRSDTGSGESDLLPHWYMPASRGSRLPHGWRRNTVLVMIASLVVISAYGVCSAYGVFG